MSSQFVRRFFGPTGAGHDEEPPAVRAAPWQPPDDEIGVAVALALVLGRSERGVVALTHALAHSKGLRFAFVAQARELTRRAAQMLFHEQHGADPDDLADGFLRLGVELPGGTRASNLGRRGERTDDGLVFFPCGGSGGTGGEDAVTLHQDYWLWPWPEPGTIRFSCEWPVVGIPLSSVELDAAPLVEARAKVVPLWPSA